MTDDIESAAVITATMMYERDFTWLNGFIAVPATDLSTKPITGQIIQADLHRRTLTIKVDDTVNGIVVGNKVKLQLETPR